MKKQMTASEMNKRSHISLHKRLGSKEAIKEHYASLAKKSWSKRRNIVTFDIPPKYSEVFE